MNKEAIFRQELRLPFVNRMWSLQRAQRFVNYVITNLEYEDPVVVVYGTHGNFSGYYAEWENKIYICRNNSTIEKWRTLVHELTHVFRNDHSLEFLEYLHIVSKEWRTFNTLRLYN